MLRTLAVLVLCLFLVPSAPAQHLWLDASQFNKALPSTLTPPADSWTVNTAPAFTIH